MASNFVLQQDRTELNAIRIFVSSTFLDMGKERDVLVQRTFTKLRRLVEAAGTTLQEIDFRWGVTAEERDAGAVLNICLSEIDACRPFFIAILGERYGWIDPANYTELSKSYPHLQQFANRSLTELEIRHAVLNSPPELRPTVSFFYIRSTVFSDSVQVAPEVHRLIQEIREQGLSVQVFSNPLELDALVEADLLKTIRAHLPQGPLASLTTRAQSAYKSYLGAPGFQRQRELHRLQRALWFSRRIVVQGAAGLGKSSLLLALHKSAGDFSRFGSLTAAAGKWPALIEAIVPDAPEATSLDLRYAQLESLVENGTGLTIIDAIDETEASPLGSVLEWIPRVKPRGAIVVSTNASAISDELRRLGFRAFSVGPTDTIDLEAIVRETLIRFGKKLSPNVVQKIVMAMPERTPEYARILLELLRQFGLFENLDLEISRLLSAASTQELFELALVRLEQLQGMPLGYVSRVLTLMLAGRSGLSENEILNLSGSTFQPALIRDWAPIHHTLSPFLFARGGVLSIQTPSLVAAVVKRYRIDNDAWLKARCELAQHFLDKALEARSIDELVFLLPRIRAWRRSHALLVDPHWLGAAYGRDPVELRAFVAQIMSGEPSTAGQLLDGLARNALSDTLEVAQVGTAELLMRFGRPEQAAEICEFALALPRSEKSDRARYALRLILADTRVRAGRARAALSILRGLHDHARSDAEFAEVKERAALVALEVGEFDIAGRLVEEAKEALPLKSPSRLRIRLQLHSCLVLIAQGTYRKALRELSALERQVRRTQDAEGLVMALAGRAIALRQLGRPRQALRVHLEEERLWRLIGDAACLSRCLVNQALVRVDLDDFDAADDLFESAAHGASLSGNDNLLLDVKRRHLALLEKIGGLNGFRATSIRNAIESIQARIKEPSRGDATALPLLYGRSHRPADRFPAGP